MKRVLIITYYWPPSGGAGVQRWLKFSKYLPEYGWEPVVLTVDPAYASYPVRDESLLEDAPTDLRVIRTRSRELFSFYKKVTREGNIPYAGFANETGKTSLKQKVARFIRGNFFIPDPRKGWNRYAIREASTLIREKSVQAIITTSPPHSTQLIGLKLSRKFSIPWIADFRDPWTDIYYYKQFYPTLPAHLINLRMERNVIRGASLVSVVGEGWKELLLMRGKTDEGKFRVITNGYDESDFKNLPGIPEGVFTVTYAGTMADNYPIETFMAAFRRLIKEGKKMKLRVVGTLPGSMAGLMKALPEESVELTGYVSHAKAVEYMSASNALLLLIPSIENNVPIIPGKIFEYLAVKRPILVVGPTEGDSAHIVNESGAGAAVAPGDEEEAYKALKAWLDGPALKPAIESYSRRQLAAKFGEALDNLT